MRTLNETEMNIVAGGVDPVPVSPPEPLPRPDPEDVYWLLQSLSMSKTPNN